MDESLLEKENPKNPMLLSPVVSCVLKILNIKEIKNCRHVCRVWGSTGKIVLQSRARVHIEINRPDRGPEDFISCFLSSATLFSVFEISGYFARDPEDVADYWRVKELTKFFTKQQNYIKELALNFEYCNEKIEKNIDISCWISKSPLVQRDAKYLTKLSIGGRGKVLDIPLHLLVHIKDLRIFTNCRINFEEGTKICPIKLTLLSLTFYQNGVKLDRVRINDIVDFTKAKEVSLYNDSGGKNTKYVLGLGGNVTLDKLVLEECEIVNGEKSEWSIEQLVTIRIPYSLNCRMKIKELSLFRSCPIDLFNLPNSIEKLGLHAIIDDTGVSCSQPLVLENLKCLHLFFWVHGNNLPHFRNCPQLTHLKFHNCDIPGLKFSSMPKNLKTLMLEKSPIYWIKDCYLNLRKLILYQSYSTYKAKEFFNAKIRVQDLVLFHWRTAVNQNLVELLDYRNRFNYVKRLYIGELEWGEKQLENSVLKEYVHVKSAFYVFESGEKGRVVSKEDFFELVPKNMDIGPYA